MEYEFSNILDFGGISSGDAEAAIRRADKGGMVSAEQFRALVSMLQGEGAERQGKWRETLGC